MRVYLFNVENGLYEGEDFCDAKEIKPEEGITAVAPPDVQRGQAPVYDAELCRWRLVPIEVMGGRKNV